MIRNKIWSALFLAKDLRNKFLMCFFFRFFLKLCSKIRISLDLLTIIPWFFHCFSFCMASAIWLEFLHAGLMYYSDEKFCLQGYNAVYFVESLVTFRRNMSPPSSGSKNKPNKKATELCLPPVLTLISCSDFSSILKVGWFSTDYTVFYPRR
jgi:hypothetical protein